MAGTGIAIFAKHGTKERKILFANPKINNLLEIANKDDDGNWVLVDELELMDVLTFECDEVYLGYDGVKYAGYCGSNLVKKALKYIAKYYG